MNDSVNIGYHRPTFLIYSVSGLALILNSIYLIIWVNEDWFSYLKSLFVVVMFSYLTVDAFRCLRDKRVHIRLDEQGIYLRETVRKQNGVRAMVNDLNLAWQDIERCELRFRIFNIGEMLDFHTADGACYRADILEYGIWRTRKLARKIQALHQAAPEQRARLLAAF